MKFILRICLVVLIFSLIGCSGNDSNSNANAGGETNSKDNGDTINLTATIHNAPGIPFTDGFTKYLEEIEKRSEGKVSFEIFYSETLTPGENVVDALKSGVVDVAAVLPEWQSGKMSLATIANNPGVYEDVWSGTMAMNDLYENNEAMQNMLDELSIKKLGVFVNPPTIIHSKTDVSGFEDLENLRVLTSSKTQASVAQNLGMSPVGMSVNDAYEGLDKGAIDSVFLNLSAASALSFDEVLKSMWTAPVSGQSGLYAMNINVYNDLPDDVKAVIEEVQEDFNADMLYELYDKADSANIEKYTKNGIEINEATEEQVEKLRNLTGDVWDQWIKEQEDKGLPGQEVLESFMELVNEYNEEHPYEGQ